MFYVLHLPNTMTRATSDIRDGDISVPLANGDAVITSANGQGSKIDIIAAANVDAISVVAIFRGRDVEVSDGDIGALLDAHVEAFAIEKCEVGNFCITNLA